jgi:hypothetical protein
VGPFSLPAEALIETATANKENRTCFIVTVNLLVVISSLALSLSFHAAKSFVLRLQS